MELGDGRARRLDSMRWALVLGKGTLGEKRQVKVEKSSFVEIYGITVEIVRKRIRNLHLRVYPPDGRVRVSAPMRLGNDVVRDAIVSRLDWIRRHQEDVRQQRRPTREMVAGESHYVEGRPYRLEVTEVHGPASVRLISPARMELRVRPGSTPEQRRKVLDRWYRARLHTAIPTLIAKWEPVMGVEVAAWRTRRMKSRWGSCNPRVRRICLNLELAEKPEGCLEYIVVHEMVHILERSHNRRFYRLMNTFMPQWRAHREELKRHPSGEETGHAEPACT